MSTRRRTRIIEPEPSPTKSRPARSPARSRKASPARKSPPAREIAPKPKSPSRKSPSRKVTSKYPARKSPARTAVKEVDPIAEELQISVPRSPAKRPSIQTNSSVRLESISSMYRATRSKRIDYKDIFAEKEGTPEKNGITEFGLRNRSTTYDETPYTPRRSSRLRDFIEVVPSLPDIRRSVSKSISKHSRTPSKSVSKSLEEYSDEEHSADEIQKVKLSSQQETLQPARKLSTPLRTSVSNLTLVARQWEFGGRIGTAGLIILIPLTVISILTSCMKSCSVQTLLNITPFKSLAPWFSVSSSSLILAQILIQALIAVFPYLGPKAIDITGKKHCFNAFFSSVIAVTLIYLLNYLEIINNDLILLEYLRLATASYIFALILSIALYVKTRKFEKDEINQYANTGYFLYDFFLGREIHPSIKNINVKIWNSRICNINTLILSLLIFSRAIKIEWTIPEETTISNPLEHLGNIQFQISNYTVLVFSMIQILYSLNFIMKEYRVTSTFYWQSEGVGYLQLVSSSLYPFYFTSISKHISDTGLILSTNVLVIASLLFLLGFGLMLISNDIKYEFRRDPLQPSLAKLESMMTFNGKRLITSHVWGALRHPNYTGDIIIHIVLALPGLLSGQVIAASPALITILVLLHRAWRDDARCQRRYGSAWTRYCKRVPSVIIPKVL